MLLELTLLFLAMIVQVIIPPIPAELITIYASSQYGIIPAGTVAGTGLYIGSLIVYWMGRALQRHVAFFKKENVEAAIQRIRQYEDGLLWVRILPYNPADIISYAAGIIKTDWKKFAIITGIASYTRSFTLAILGDNLTSTWSIIGVLAVLAISAYIGYKATYGNRKEKNIQG